MAATELQTDATAALQERVRDDFPFWAEKFAKIVDKQGRLVPFKLKEGQLRLDAALEAQRAEGKPMRAYVLKARQLGFSTAIQGKLLHRCTLRERYDAVAVAQDKETGAKLYRMAETMYSNLEEDDWLKPTLGQHRRQQFLHFTGGGLWQQGGAFPDSRYTVDTAGEFQAGRGGTYRGVHASEAAFWPRLDEKLTSLMAAVPDDPETMFVIESTANGFNAFKDRWDDAFEGHNQDWIAFFWPWFKDSEYSRPFASETERELFIVGDPNISYAEKEPDLIKRHELTIEQIHWRRRKIASDYGGDVRYFQQEYPSTPEEAFIATGQKVFDPWKAQQLMVRAERTDPRIKSEETPGPLIGDFTPAETETLPTFSEGTIEVPTKTLWTPREQGGPSNPTSPWRFWLDLDDHGIPIRSSEYVMGVDVSGGNTETTRETDYHAIEIIDHKTRQQVAEYRSRIDPDLLADEILLAALFFNQALVAIERTGSHGAGPLRRLSRDMHYPRIYTSVRIGGWNEPEERKLGWDTNVRTKPLLLEGMAALLRTEEDGIRSRLLAGEVRTYTRTEKGAAEAEPGKYDDLLMAYMIAQQVARDEPLLGQFDISPQAGGFVAAGGMGAYDARYR